MPDLVPIYNAGNLVEAQLLRDELAERGIAAYIINASLSGAVGEVPPGWSSTPRVVVETADAEQAREVALLFDQRNAERRRLPEERARPEPVVISDDWPRCAMCGERRLAVCKICGTAGTEFPTAHQLSPAGEEERPLLVVCTMCDEPFTPRFYKECARCGFEFEDGIASERPNGDIDVLTADVRRVWLVMGAMLLLFFGCGAYLWWLLR